MPDLRVRLEELEARLAPASFAVNAQLGVSRLDDLGDTALGMHAVVFFESAVTDYQVLRQGLGAGTDAVVLDSAGDGVRQMAAFLAGRHDLTKVGVVAHGAPGAVMLGTTALDIDSLGSYGQELATVASALGRGGELDLWSCDVAAGLRGELLMRGLTAALHTGVAASDHLVGSAARGGNWQLDVRVAGALGDAQFSGDARAAFDELLGTWGPAASMATARGLHTATLLGNGKVLIAAGGDTSAYLSSAELYDPSTNTWSTAGSLGTAREDHTATLLKNGMVLVAGGGTTNSLVAKAELYDPVKNSWSAAGSMATAREAHTATLLPNGKVLVTGGGVLDFFNPQALASAELYDPVTNSWSSAGSMATARVGHKATLLGNGLVLVVGGNVGGVFGTFLSSAELYNPATNTWSSAASMASGRLGPTATLLGNGKVLVSGGLVLSGALASAELYDSATNTWSSAGSMAGARSGHTATLLGNGTVLVTGGTVDTSTGLASAELYDPVTNTWSSAGSMATARVTHTTTLLGDGRVLVAGGASDADTPLASAELYTPALPAAKATQLVITNLSATSLPAGNAVSFTLTAKDSTSTTVPGYTGKVQITSTDARASAGGSGLPASYTFVAADNGARAFTVMLATAASQTITVTDQADHGLTATTSPITVTAGPFSKYLVSPFGGTALVTGNLFVVTVQAADQFGNAVSSYSGPTTFTATVTPPDPQANIPVVGTLNGSGFGLVLGSLKTAGAYTLTASAGTYSGTSGNLTVAPSAANYYTVSAPAVVTTGSPFNVTVTAFDHFGNIATGYTGTVKLTSTDPAAALLVAGYTFTSGAGKDNGVHTFSATLKTGRSQAITATDAASTNPIIAGSSSAIAARGLVVSAFSPTATGFTVAFSTPFIPGNLSLWGGTVASPVRNVTLVGDASGPINGSLIIDPTNTSIAFKASALYLSSFFGTAVLPNDTWHATLVSGSGAAGFKDALGAGLDGANNGGSANYATTFTTANAAKAALSIPDFARGPAGTSTIKVPNDSANGIPVTLTNAAGVKDVVFTLSYNPTLLTPTGAGTADASGPGSTFTMGSVTNIDATHAAVSFTFHNATAQPGTVILGDILAVVPNSAANVYKAKEFLGLGSITVNGAVFTGVSAGGLHVNAYFGDLNGDHASPKPITGVDVALAQTVSQGTPTAPIGLAAFPLVDPAIVGDIAGDASIDATAVSDLASFTSNLNAPQIPNTFMTITANGPDPTLSLGGAQRQGDKEKGGQGETSTSPGLLASLSPVLVVSVPVLLDQARPEGSTGLNEAILALSYDPSVLSVSVSDITLGSIPSLGTGWQLHAVVDQTRGQIGIELYSMTPILSAQAGSLVNIAFHVLPGVSVPTTAVQLVPSVMPGGQGFTTELADEQGQLILSTGRDRLVVHFGSSRGGKVPGTSHRLIPGTARL